MALRVGFAGTPAFAATALVRIVDAGFSVPLVLTRPDTPKGRGQQVAGSPVKLEAARRGLPLAQPRTLRDPDAVAGLRAVPLDVLVVAAYGLILPPDVLDWPRHGGLNIHASLLPRWRGAAPIERAIEAGDRMTGITIMQMDAGLDTGPVVAAHELAIHPRETSGALRARLAALGAEAIVEALSRLDREGALAAAAQPSVGVTHARKIERDEARIDWRASAAAIDRRVRAFEPEPGAFTLDGAERIKVRSSLALGGGSSAAPGTVVAAGAQGIDVACGEGTLRIVELQPAGGRRMGAAAYLAGRSLAPGHRLGGDGPA
jgi:methionyl-tRNA formyltransferase